MRRVMTAGFETLPLDDGTLVMPGRLAEALGLRVGDLVTVEALEGARRSERLRVAALAGDLLGMLAYATRTTANRLTGDRDTITSVRLRLDAHERRRFYEAVRGVPRFASVGDKTLMVRHFRETTTRNLLVFTGILSAFAACIAIGVVYNNARIALAERSWELATLRVLGFTRSEVSRILLWQVGVPIIVAIPLGCALGYALARLLAALIHGPEFSIPAVVLPATYALAILVMLGASAVSGLVVRRRIDDLDLIGVLKTWE
jgi:putative ABC transport system permease protein